MTTFLYSELLPQARLLPNAHFAIANLTYMSKESHESEETSKTQEIYAAYIGAIRQNTYIVQAVRSDLGIYICLCVPNGPLSGLQKCIQVGDNWEKQFFQYLPNAEINFMCVCHSGCLGIERAHVRKIKVKATPGMVSDFAFDGGFKSAIDNHFHTSELKAEHAAAIETMQNKADEEIEEMRTAYNTEMEAMTRYLRSREDMIKEKDVLIAKQEKTISELQNVHYENDHLREQLAQMIVFVSLSDSAPAAAAANTPAAAPASDDSYDFSDVASTVPIRCAVLSTPPNGSDKKDSSPARMVLSSTGNYERVRPCKCPGNGGSQPRLTPRNESPPRR